MLRGCFSWGRRCAVFQCISQRVASLVINGCVERDWLFDDAEQIHDLAYSEIARLGYLLWQRIKAILLRELCRDPTYLAQSCCHMFRKVNESRLLTCCAADCLANPPSSIGPKMATALVVKLFRGTHQAEIALLNKIDEGNAGTCIATRDSDNESKI